MLVTATYDVPEQDEDAFLEAMAPVRRARQRTGAYRWALYRDGEVPHRFVEAYLVPSWEEHLRQHQGRMTESDAAADRRARAYARRPPEAHHLFPALARPRPPDAP